jgi:cytidylate kinase
MTQPPVQVIAIDGPAASGKSTVSIGLARQLGIGLLDSGSMYRAVALLAVEREVELESEEALLPLAEEVSRSFRMVLPAEGPPRIFLGEREVTGDIRSPLVGKAVSEVSSHAAVRGVMVKLQRAFVLGRPSVVEGRDIGTTVFPDAPLKVFLDASPDERVRRRHREISEAGKDLSADRVRKELEHRDSLDSSREVSPLSPSGDAFRVDTTRMSVDEVVDAVITEVKKRGFSFE